MNSTNQLLFEKLEKKIQRYEAYSLGFLGFLMLNEGFGELQTLKYFFLNMAGLLALVAFLIGFIGSLILQSKGIKLKHAQTVIAYEALTLLMSGAVFSHYYLVVKGAFLF